MVSVEKVKEILMPLLAEKEYELVTLEVSASDEIRVELDSYQGVSVDDCAALNGQLCAALDAEYGEDADYSLELGSVSLTDPFKTKMQYEKHVGDDVEVLAADGKKYRGQLVSADEDTFSIDTEVKVQVAGKKRTEKQIQTMTWGYGEVKYTRYELKF